jgi:aspartate racemase
MHRVVPQIEASISIPVLHIADATAAAIKSQGLHTIGLLGTRFTMEQDFYAGRLQDQHGLQVLVPPPADRELVHRVIYTELVLGDVRAESRDEYLRIINDLQSAGAQGIIAGCTEIGMLVQQEHTSLPLFDTTRIHAEAAVVRALDAAD